MADRHSYWLASVLVSKPLIEGKVFASEVSNGVILRLEIGFPKCMTDRNSDPDAVFIINPYYPFFIAGG